ncbi:hypothetical protein [Nocardia transvalensis]|uniref:hypothetical protein n=1 Tax=Nocardia transvalensis TaxID=37333 RepID=UPI001E3DB650|nr:hypothetical protein [Nocardia transvalensis]
MNGRGEPGEDMLSSTESLDSDEVRNDDGDAVVAPPDDWTGADRYGMTSREQREGQPLADRLAQEEPDVGAGRSREDDGGTAAEGIDAVRPDTRGHAATPSRQHAGQIDDTPEDGESFYPVEE